MDKQLLSKLLFWVMAAIGTVAIVLSARRAKAKRAAQLAAKGGRPASQSRGR